MNLVKYIVYDDHRITHLLKHLKTRIFEYLLDVLIKKKCEKLNFQTMYLANQENVDGKNRSHRHAFKENTCCFWGDTAFLFSSMIIG